MTDPAAVSAEEVIYPVLADVGVVSVPVPEVIHKYVGGQMLFHTAAGI